ncbi:helix-turn-helix transcriptional regulator [Sphingobium boeckii]|uniref:helix-turn-helix transcriptional regulator n=1 Tax=Sphingobium boeckii TaxID=1082345 RepID=UPI003CCDAD0C
MGRNARAGIRLNSSACLVPCVRGHDTWRRPSRFPIYLVENDRSTIGLIAGAKAEFFITVQWVRSNASLAGCRPMSIRERDCLRYVAEGMKGDAVAHKLGLARVTVDLHLKCARQKLKAATLAEAKALTYREIRST